MGQENNPKTQILRWTRSRGGTNATNVDTSETNQNLSIRGNKVVMQQSRGRTKEKHGSMMHDNKTSLTTHSAIDSGENDDSKCY